MAWMRSLVTPKNKIYNVMLFLAALILKYLSFILIYTVKRKFEHSLDNKQVREDIFILQNFVNSETQDSWS